jgi:hypothetical protein
MITRTTRKLTAKEQLIYDSAKEQTTKKINEFFKDHYWDELEYQKSLLYKHWVYIINNFDK